MRTPIPTHVLGPADLGLLHALLDLYATAFDDPEALTLHRPSDDHLRALLTGGSFVAIAALDAGRLVGGLSGYFLPKPESAAPEFYLYDLAVAESHRRRGIASALIDRCRRLARERGASSIFVQAHPEDEAAVALYETKGSRTEVLHFDIATLPPN
jgi:aminoglycoside 3-N-acetyltransferase I